MKTAFGKFATVSLIFALAFAAFKPLDKKRQATLLVFGAANET